MGGGSLLIILVMLSLKIALALVTAAGDARLSYIAVAGGVPLLLIQSLTSRVGQTGGLAYAGVFRRHVRAYGQ